MLFFDILNRLQDADEFTEVDITERGALKKYVSELFSQTNFLWFSMMNIVQVKFDTFSLTRYLCLVHIVDSVIAKRGKCAFHQI